MNLKLLSHVNEVIRNSYSLGEWDDGTVIVTKLYDPMVRLGKYYDVQSTGLVYKIKDHAEGRPYTPDELLRVFRSSGSISIKHVKTGTVSRVIGMSFDGNRVICAGTACNWPMDAERLFRDYTFLDGKRCGC